MIKILDTESQFHTIEHDSTDEDSTTIRDNMLMSLIGSGEAITQELEDLDYDEDKFLDKYYESMYSYLTEAGYTENDIDLIIGEVIDNLFN